MQHQLLASGQWDKLSFPEQMGHIGSEVGRSIKWREKGQEKLAWQAFVRSTELLWLSVESARNHPARLRELTRARECWFDFFAFENRYCSTGESFIKYFDGFTKLLLIRSSSHFK